MSSRDDTSEPPPPGEVDTPRDEGRGRRDALLDDGRHPPPLEGEEDEVYEDASDAGEVLLRRQPPLNTQPPPAPPRVSTLPAMRPDNYDGTSDWSEYLIYFEQLSELNEWDDERKAAMLSLVLRGEARVVLASMDPAKRRSYFALKEAMSSSFAPTEMMHLHRAELKARKKQPGESMLTLGREIAKLVRQAYPTADAATRETLGINSFLEALPGPASEMKLHVIKGRPRTLQEAVAHATEVDAVIEAESRKNARKRGDVRMVKGGPDDEVTILREELKSVREELEKMKRGGSDFRRKREVVCFGCGKSGHIRRNCREVEKKPVQGNGERRQD